jgi:hypothetical protein
MNVTRWFGLAGICAAVLVTGCVVRTTTFSSTAPAVPGAAAPGPKADGGEGNEEATIKANLDKLSPEDRKLAEEQKFCAVNSDDRLGEMGVPVKVMVKDQPVFLCCKSCKKEAEDNPDKTLAKVKELKEKNAAKPKS